MNKKIIPVMYALLAAVFYALSTPFSKYLLKDISSTFLAAFLYIGAGVGVGILYVFHWKKEKKEDRLGKKDIPYTVGMVVLDILAPIFMMQGLKMARATNASLLGNFEIVATALIALLLFREKITRRLWWAIGLITAASFLLSMDGLQSFSFSAGSLLVLLATCCWGLENNCTRSISGKSTYEIVTIKGLCSGTGALIVALFIGEPMPEISAVSGAMALGFVAYGLSIFTYIRAQRFLGAAKTSAYYAAAPFIGVALSALVNGERLGGTFVVALVIMLFGAILVALDTFKRK